jgi:general secretion pathway protein N
VSRRGLVAALVLAVLGLGVALLPLRLVLMLGGGLAAAGVQGSVWQGRLDDAQWGGMALGDLEVALSPASVLRLAPEMRLDGPQLSGALRLGGAPGVVGVQGRAQPLTPGLAAWQLEGLTLRFGRDGCEEAGGRVTLRMGGDVLAGVPRCAGDVAELALARPDGVVVSALRIGRP